MQKIEITTQDPERVLPVLKDAIERQKRILTQSLARTEARINELATHLNIDPNLLLSSQILHPEEKDMDLLELEGELEILHHLREQLESLEHITICS